MERDRSARVQACSTSALKACYMPALSELIVGHRSSPFPSMSVISETQVNSVDSDKPCLQHLKQMMLASRYRKAGVRQPSLDAALQKVATPEQAPEMRGASRGRRG